MTMPALPLRLAGLLLGTGSVLGSEKLQESCAGARARSLAVSLSSRAVERLRQSEHAASVARAKTLSLSLFIYRYLYPMDACVFKILSLVHSIPNQCPPPGGGGALPPPPVTTPSAFAICGVL